MTNQHVEVAKSVSRVLHLSQSDRAGGANRAAFRLHRALQEIGVSSTFCAGRKLGNGDDVVAAWPPVAGDFLSNLVAWAAAQHVHRVARPLKGTFSSVALAYGWPRRSLIQEADVICLHWIAGSFLKPSQLCGFGRPLIWRLSDLWPFTGGCHYPGACRAFETRCGQCPMLGSDDPADLSARGFAARARAYPALDLTIVAPSRWIAEQARRSALFGERRIEHIATGVDLGLYRPWPRSEARARCGLPADARIVLFGAIAATSDERKGYSHMQEALRLFAGSAVAKGTVVVVFGGARAPDQQMGALTVRHIGHVVDEDQLAALYAAGDVLVAPFLEENLPNVVLESLACGTPVAAYAAGGIPDAVEHQINGYLAATGSTEQLAHGIAWILEDSERLERLRHNARTSAEQRFDIRSCAQRYRSLITELSQRARRP